LYTRNYPLPPGENPTAVNKNIIYIEKNAVKNKTRKRKERNKKKLSTENYRGGNGNE
jgi:hypothetical protein